MKNDQLKLIELQKELDQLKSKNLRLEKDLMLLISIFKDSSPTKLVISTILATQKESKIGFFGKTPAGQQTLASDTLANLLIALRNLGLIS